MGNTFSQQVLQELQQRKTVIGSLASSSSFGSLSANDNVSPTSERKIYMTIEAQEMENALRNGHCPWHRKVELESGRRYGTTLDHLRCKLCDEEYRIDLERVKSLNTSESSKTKGLSEEFVTVLVESPCLQPSHEVKVFSDDTIVMEDYVGDVGMKDMLTEASPLSDVDDRFRQDHSHVTTEESSTAIEDVDLDSSSEDVDNKASFNYGEEEDSINWESQKNALDEQTRAAHDNKLTIEAPHESDAWVLFLTEKDVHSEYDFRRNVSYMDADIFHLLLAFEFFRHRVLNCYPYASRLRIGSQSRSNGYLVECANKTEVVMTMSMVSDGSCGKTSLVERYMYKTFSVDRHSPNPQRKQTEFHARSFQNFPNLNVRLDIQVIPDEVSNASRSIYSRSHCVVVVFSVDEPLRPFWLQEVARSRTLKQDIIICLNKIDLPGDKWLFGRDEFHHFINQFDLWSFQVLETSAAENLNVEELFFACACTIYQNKSHKVHRSAEPLIPNRLRMNIENCSQANCL